MKIRRLVIKNYKLFRGSHEIIFPDNRKGKNVFLILGDCASGKTSVVEAIRHCLYGAKKDVMFRSIHRREGSVEDTTVLLKIIFEDDGGSELSVRRSWEADGDGQEGLIESFVVEKDGEMMGEDNVSCQDYINSVFPPEIVEFFFFDGEELRTRNLEYHPERSLASIFQTEPMNQENLRDKTLKMYQLLSKDTGLIKDILIDERTGLFKIVGPCGCEAPLLFSIGDRFVYVLSVFWAFTQTIEGKFPVILDNPVAVLDLQHRENLWKNYFPNAGKQVILLLSGLGMEDDFYSGLEPYLAGVVKLEFRDGEAVILKYRGL